MLQPGRKSRDSVLAFVPDVAEIRLQPPSWLSKDEAKLFSELVNATRAAHFTRSDEPLLIAYVQATLLAR